MQYVSEGGLAYKASEPERRLFEERLDRERLLSDLGSNRSRSPVRVINLRFG